MGGYPIVAAVGTLAATNYSFTFVNGTLTVGKATVTVTADAAVAGVWGGEPTFTAAYSGFVNGDTLATSGVTGRTELTTTATPASAMGGYPIVAAVGTLAATNYSFTFVNGTLTVGKATVTVTADAASRAYGAANPTFTAGIQRVRQRRHVGRPAASRAHRV